MVSAQSLMEGLRPRTIAKRVQVRHDQARNNYRLQNNTVDDFREFERIIGDYYNVHFAECFSGGARLPHYEAESRAKAILAQHYRNSPRAITDAFNNAYEGTKDGMRGILDVIANGLKQEATENYIRNLFDKHVSPVDDEEKLQLIEQVVRSQPEVLREYQGKPLWGYAMDYEPLVRRIAESLGGVQDAMRGVGRAP